jgi:hypothetical protein
MRARSFALVLTLVALAALALPPRAVAGDTQIVVYNKGKTLRYDPDVGAELKEVFLETYDCATGKLAKKETIEAYFHLSDDKEIITPDAICDRCRTKFIIEKKGEKYYFGGVRDKAATIEEANKAAPAPGPGEGLKTLEGKVKRIAQEVVKIGFAAGTGPKRARIITDEFTTSLQNFGEQELTDVAGFVLDDKTLERNDKYNVLRSFGYTFYEKKDYTKSVFFYDKCIELIPENYSAYFQKAAAHEDNGDADGAIRAYGKSLARCSDPKLRTRCAKKLSTLLERTPSTTKLTPDKIGDLKAKLDGIAGKPPNEALEAAQSLDEQIDAYYASAGGGSGAPKTPPPPRPIEGPGPGPEPGPGPGPGGTPGDSAPPPG